jgi:hypothetical protein
MVNISPSDGYFPLKLCMPSDRYFHLNFACDRIVIGSDHMQSIRAANVREAVRKNEIRPWPIDFICCAALCAEPFCMGTYLLYWTVRRAFLRKFCFLTVVATMRTANLCHLAWGEYQATGKKLSALTHSRLSTVSLR